MFENYNQIPMFNFSEGNIKNRTDQTPNESKQECPCL